MFTYASIGVLFVHVCVCVQVCMQAMFMCMYYKQALRCTCERPGETEVHVGRGREQIKKINEDHYYNNDPHSAVLHTYALYSPACWSYVGGAERLSQRKD